MAMEQRGPRDVLRDYLARHGLKHSRQRDLIAETFFAAEGHLSVDELLKRVRAEDARVGQATVYRAMKLLMKCGLAEMRQFGDGHTRYEHTHGAGEPHHDHLICTDCGRIDEFVDHQIEALQDRIAEAHGFVVKHHKMELYGICPACQRAKGGGRLGDG
jgi:Fur family ferric uptake transcriptional regulator